MDPLSALEVTSPGAEAVPEASVLDGAGLVDVSVELTVALVVVPVGVVSEPEVAVGVVVVLAPSWEPPLLASETGV